MDVNDSPESENIEDRRGEATSANVSASEGAFTNLDDPSRYEHDEHDEDPKVDIKKITGDEWKYGLTNLGERAVGAGPWMPARRGSLEQQAGRNYIPYAKGGTVTEGPVTRHLQIITKHPKLPNVKVVRNKPIPYLAGSSNDAKTVYIDPSVPRVINVNKKLIDPAGPLSVHEVDGRIAIHLLLEAMQNGKLPQMSKPEMFQMAKEKVGEPAERQYLVDTYGFNQADWDRYQQIMQMLTSKIAHQGLDQAPKDFYTFTHPSVNQS